MIKVGEINGKYYILTVEQKRVALIGNNTKRGLEITPWKRELEARFLNSSKIQIKKQLKNKNNYCPILVVKYVESSYR